MLVLTKGRILSLIFLLGVFSLVVFWCENKYTKYCPFFPNYSHFLPYEHKVERIVLKGFPANTGSYSLLSDFRLKRAQGEQSNLAKGYVEAWSALGVHSDYPMAILLGHYPDGFTGHPQKPFTMKVEPVGGPLSQAFWEEFHNHKKSLPHYASYDAQRSCLAQAGNECHPEVGEAPTPMQNVNSTGNAIRLNAEGFISGSKDGRGWSRDRSIIVPALPREWIADDGFNYVNTNDLRHDVFDRIRDEDSDGTAVPAGKWNFPYLDLPSTKAPKNWNPHKTDMDDTYNDWSINYKEDSGVVKIVAVNVTHFWNNSRLVGDKHQVNPVLDVPTQNVSLAMARLMLAMAYRTGNYEPPKWLTDEERQGIRNAREHIPGLHWQRRTWLIWELMTN